MDFTVLCECGAVITVPMTSAGTQLQCSCGSTVEVPSLAQLRSNAGLAAVDVPLDYEVSRLLETGELPTDTCVECGSAVAEVVKFVAVCEQFHVKKSGGLAWAIMLISLGRFFIWQDEVVELHGRTTIIPVPASLCDHCRRNLVHAPPTPLLKKLGTFAVIAGVCLLFLVHWAIAAVVVIGGLLSRLSARLLLKRYQQHLKQSLSNIPVYGRVFEEYPDTLITIKGGSQ